MKKRVKSLLLGVATIVGFGSFAVACDDLTVPMDGHKHTYSDAWMADADGHWHALTCEDCTEEPVKEAHVDKNNDGACDYCEYMGDHEHTYSHEWTVDCTNHWHAADCGHIVAGDGIAAHVDKNADGECDVCFYIINDIHEHYFASEWASDSAYHWNAALCEHKDQITNKAAHELNAAGDCTVCGAHINDVDETDLGAVLAAAVANNYKVAYGDVVASEMVYDDADMNVLANGKINQVHFALGNDASYIHYVSFDKDGNYIGKEEQWYEKTGGVDEDGNPVIFGAKLTDKTTKLEPTMGAAQFLNGYNYLPGNVLPNAADDTSTLANILSGLYNVMKTDAHVSEAVEGYLAETGDYAFAFNYFTVNETTVSESAGALGGTPGEKNFAVELYNVGVTFRINDEMIIDQANFYVKTFRNWELDMDLTYDKETDSITLLDTASPTIYTYSVSQTAGERTFTTPYPRKSLIPTSFEFTYVPEDGWEWNEDCTEMIIFEEEKIEESLTIQEGTYAKFRISNFLPVTADPGFLDSSDFEYYFVNKDPNSTGKCWYDSDSSLNGYSSYNKMLKLKIRDVGEYTVTIKFGDLIKTFDIIVEVEKLPEDGEDTENTINVRTTDNNGWFDKYSYTAKESGTYTFTIPAGLGVWNADDCDNNPFNSQPEVDYNTSPNGGSFEVALAADETFEFYVGSTEKKAWVINVSFVAGDVGGGDVGGDEPEVDNSKYETVLVEGSNTLYFSAAEVASEAATRKFNVTVAGDYDFAPKNTLFVEIKDADGNLVVRNADYTYPLSVGEYNVTFKMLKMLGHTADTAVTCTITNTTSVQPEEPAEPEAVETTIVEGENNLTIAENTYIQATVYLKGDYTLTWNDENVIVKVGGSEIASGNTVTFNPMGVTLTIYGADYAAVEVTLTITAGNQGGDVGGGEGEDPNPDQGETEEPVGYLYYDTVNDITVTAADIEKGYVLYAFYADDAGNYEFLSGDVPVLAITDSEGNEVTTEEYGVYALDSYTMYLVKINTAWVSSAGTYELNVSYQYPEGHQNNPIQLWATGDYTATYAGNYASAVWHTYTPEVDGVLTVSTTSTTATVIIGFAGATMPENVGEASLNVLAGMTYCIGVAEFEATEAVEIAFTVAVTAGEYVGDGTQNMPAMMELGEVTAVVPEWGATYYAYKATANGTLVLTTADENADLNVKVPDVEEPICPENGTIYVEMYEGQVVIVYVSTMNYAAATVVINASWKAAPTGIFEGVTIVEGDNQLSIEENTYIQVDVNGFEGEYTVTWDNENVIVEVDYMPFASGDTFYAYYPSYPFTFKVYGKNYAAVDSVTLTIAKVVVPTAEMVVGENTVAGTSQGTDAQFTATEAGTYTFTVGANAVLVYGYDTKFEGEYYELTLEAGQTISFIVGTYDYSDSDVVITVSYTAGGDVGGDDSGDEGETQDRVGTENNPYIVTELPYTISFDAGFDAWIQYTVEEDCILVISYTGGSFDGLPAGVFQKDMVAKTYTGTVTAGQVLKFCVYSGLAQTYTISVAELGSTANPYVVEALPFTYTVTGTHDFYATYTATEDCTILITCPANCFVSELPNSISKNAEGNYQFAVKAGDVITMNPWTTSADEVDYTYTISVVTVVEPEEPEQGGDEGNEGVSEAKAITLSSDYNGTIYYMTTTVSGGMITASKTDAGAWYMEETTDGFYLFYLDNGTKTYLYMTNGSSNDAFATTTDVTAVTGQVWHYDEASGMIKNNSFTGRYIGYYGTRGAFRTVNAGNSSGNPAASYEEVV